MIRRKIEDNTFKESLYYKYMQQMAPPIYSPIKEELLLVKVILRKVNDSK